MISVDLNADMGESFGAWKMGDDRALLDIVTSANVACGFHAGDPLVMAITARACVEKGVAIAAHPGFDDREGFGRRRILGIEPARLLAMLRYQLGALEAIARAEGGSVVGLKAHGALSNMAAEDQSIARAVVDVALEAGVVPVVQASTALERAAVAGGGPLAREAFADRGYRADGTLVPRGEAGASIDDPAVAAERMVRAVLEGKVRAVDGEEIAVAVDTICVHGDGPEALRLAEAVRARLEREGVALSAYAAPARARRASTRAPSRIS